MLGEEVHAFPACVEGRLSRDRRRHLLKGLVVGFDAERFRGSRSSSKR